MISRRNMANLMIILVVGFPTFANPVDDGTLSEKPMRQTVKSTPSADEQEMARYVKMIQKDESNYTFIGRIAELNLSADKVIPVLRDFLSNDSGNVKSTALAVLAHYGTEAKPALPEVVQLFESDIVENYVVEAAALTLGSIADNSTTVGLLLTNRLKALQSVSPHIKIKLKRNIVLSLINFDNQEVASSATPVLQHYLNSPEGELQYAAFKALGHLSPQAESMASESSAEILTAPATIQYATLAQHKSAGMESLSSQQQLLNIITHKESPLYLRAGAMEILEANSNGNADITNAALKAMESNDRLIEQLAIKIMKKINPGDTNNIAQLAAGLRHPKDLIRHHSALGLIKFGPKAAEAVPELNQALGEVDGKTDMMQIGSYLDAIRAIGPQASSSAETLLKLMPENSAIYSGRSPTFIQELRGYILLAMADTGNVPDEALPYIAELLTTSDSAYAFACAANAAGSMGPRGSQLVPLLAKALEPDFKDNFFSFESFFQKFTANEDQYTSALLETIRALGKIGAAANPALPDLKSVRNRTQILKSFPTLEADLHRSIQLIEEASQ